MRQQQALLDEATGRAAAGGYRAGRGPACAPPGAGEPGACLFRRVQPLNGSNYVSAADLDRARAAAEQADAEVADASAALDVLLHGTRPEQIAQARAALAAATDQAQAQRLLLDKLRIVAPRDGVSTAALPAGRPAAGRCAAGGAAGRRGALRAHLCARSRCARRCTWAMQCGCSSTNAQTALIGTCA